MAMIENEWRALDRIVDWLNQNKPEIVPHKVETKPTRAARCCRNLGDLSELATGETVEHL